MTFGWGWGPVPKQRPLLPVGRSTRCLPAKGQSLWEAEPPRPAWTPRGAEVRGATGASLVVQWLGTRLPMQGTRVRALVREDRTSHRATNPVHHSY